MSSLSRRDHESREAMIDLKLRKSSRGFSLIETMIASAMTGMVVLGASTVMNTTVGAQKKTDVQSLIDREFAAGAQLAANSSIVRAIVQPNSFGDTCLTKDKTGGCASHAAGWIPYPAAGAGGQTFNTTFNLLGPCNEADPRCMVKREMFYKWVCSDAECSGVETKIIVRPLQKEALSYRARETIVRLDRRQLLDRADLKAKGKLPK
ncbi:MAG: prepilin-type N-terminal cleavage/methylation domain-containing protein [Oxalobacteraceae bacterium]|nr:MAG: prepilin-type N-terminal cleavage/methylation domain-containing protein [Oxalobacteraceae bacterium]